MSENMFLNAATYRLKIHIASNYSYKINGIKDNGRPIDELLYISMMWIYQLDCI